MTKPNDEYVWDQYTPEYSNQIKQLQSHDGLDFMVTSFNHVNDQLAIHDNLHDNWREIYHVAWELKPASIFECGCGAMYHLQNLHTILPDARVTGIDLLQSQIAFGKEFIGIDQTIADNILIGDFSAEINIKESFEFVFSHAVIMHLNTERAQNFLRNMGRISTKYIFLVEGVANHENWYQMVRDALPDYEFRLTEKFIDYGILLTKK